MNSYIQKKKDEGLRFGEAFPRIQTISFGPKVEEPENPRFNPVNKANHIPARYFVYDMLSRRWEKGNVLLIQHERI
jgi:hypothetical protein